MTTDPRARWDAAVASQRAFAAALDANDTLAPTNTPEAMKFIDDFNRALCELEDAEHELRGTSYAVTRPEWVAAYALHRNAMFRWNKRHVLDMAKRDVGVVRDDISALYALISSERMFDISDRKGRS